MTLTQVIAKLKEIDSQLTAIIESPPYSDCGVPQVRMARLLTASECLRKELTTLNKDVSVDSSDTE